MHLGSTYGPSASKRLPAGSVHLMVGKMLVPHYLSAISKATLSSYTWTVFGLSCLNIWPRWRRGHNHNDMANDRLQQRFGCRSQCTRAHADLDAPIHSPKYKYPLMCTALVESHLWDVRATVPSVHKHYPAACALLMFRVESEKQDTAFLSAQVSRALWLKARAQYGGLGRAHYVNS